MVAPAGQINLVNPDEVHTGQSATEGGWSYRMFYFGADLLQRAAAEMADRPVTLPLFTSGVINDSPLAGLIYQVHLRLVDQDSPFLEKESHLFDMLIQLIARHTDTPPVLRVDGP